LTSAEARPDNRAAESYKGESMRDRAVTVLVAALAAGISCFGVVILSSGGGERRTALVYRVAGGAGQGLLTLRRRGPLLQLYDSRARRVVRQQPLARTDGVVVTGRSGPSEDMLTVDFGGGRFALPGGVRFDGGRGGFDSLALRGGRFASGEARYSFLDRRAPQGRLLYRLQAVGMDGARTWFGQVSVVRR
jgi:hypothetical protein